MLVVGLLVAYQFLIEDYPFMRITWQQTNQCAGTTFKQVNVIPLKDSNAT